MKRFRTLIWKGSKLTGGKLFPYILLFVILHLLSDNAFALRCGTELVTIGDRKFDVLRICGKPVFIEQWTDDTVILKIDSKGEKGGVDVSHISTAHVEEWTYNFGPQRFISFLTFIDGKLSNIEDGAKGFAGDSPTVANRSRCDSLVSEGARKIEVLMNCGTADVIEDFGEDRISITTRELKVEGIFKRHNLQVDVEEWTYNLGPRKFLLFIKFENGRVVRMERGDYGY
jgi:hypothetical protein